uniref:Uncharacterized protein n=1 Tax=Arundo donax TaxID=35708 RepID=A0A0A9AUF1_ARUDO
MTTRRRTCARRSTCSTGTATGSSASTSCARCWRRWG